MTTPARVQGTYLTLTLLVTLATSLIWGINTLFLLDAGLSNYEAFAANAFFTAGMVVFEVPTGVVADVRGRRMSFLLGAATLSLGTMAYVLLWWWAAPFAAWAAVSLLLGLGFTFFTGAMEAWVTDALAATGYQGALDHVFGRALAVSGVAMLVGSVLGGVVAQATSLGVPFVMRSLLLAATFGVAFALMRDLGFTPRPRTGALTATRQILAEALREGLGRPPVRWMMLTGPFIGGVGLYSFYAMQPYLLQLYGDPSAYGIAGVAAAIVAGAKIVGGLAAPALLRLVGRRTTLMLAAAAAGAAALLVAGLVPQLVVVIGAFVLWALADAALKPPRQAYLNELIPAQQRATVLSFDSLLDSSGGVVIQPALGRTADVSGYGSTFVVAGVIYSAAWPFLLLARRSGPAADRAGRAPTSSP